MNRFLGYALLCLFLISTRLPGAIGQRDMTREAEIETALGKLDPAMVEPFRLARIAYDREDFPESERQLRIVIAKCPAFSPALRRLGASQANQGKHEEGLANCQKALALERSAPNLITMAMLIASPAKTTTSDADRERALAMLHECATLPHGDDVEVFVSICQLALQLDRQDEARAASAKLEAKYPGEMITHYFAAMTAVMDEHWVKAAREIRIAGKLGLPEAEVNRFLDSGVRTRATAWYIAGATGIGIGIWVLGLITLFGLGLLLSGATLRQAASADISLSIDPREQRLRKFYRTLLNTAGVYYYISLPVVLILVISVCAAFLYLFLCIGFLPIKLTIILVIGACITIWMMAKSLFLRVKAGDPGSPLERGEAEELWQLTDEVAKTMNTRPIDEIRLTVGTDLAVYERGTWKEKLDNKAKRILILGAAVLGDFKQDDFRSVLAHEYGHFSNRDTAGGDIAMRVENDMRKFYITMYEAGQATRFNVAFQFLRLYHFIFRRISHGATRLQEILADRVAAQTYGPAAFEGGLRHVIGQSIAFDTHANTEINEAIKARRPLNNLYSGPPSKPASFQKDFEDALNRPTTRDDTHPGPMDRFRLISRIPEPTRTRSIGFVWDLFKDRETIIHRLMTEVEENVAPHRPHLVD